MSSNVDRPIGSTFEFEGEMLEVVKGEDCVGCSLHKSDHCYAYLMCILSRKDKTQVMAIPAKTVIIEEF